MSRTAITSKEVKLLCLTSGGLCAFPGCGASLVDKDSDVDDPVILGEVAHIVADSRQGPRGDCDLSDEERNKHSNLILLCPTHHTLVDAQPNTYSVAVLRQMKEDHERAVQQHLSPAARVDVKAYLRERIQSTVLPLSFLPRFMYSAPCSFKQGQEDEVKERIVWPRSRNVLLPFRLVGGCLFAFQNLKRRNNPFGAVIDTNRVKDYALEKLEDTPDERRLYVNLLNRTMYKFGARRDLTYDVDHRRFYFHVVKPGEAREVKYRTLSGRSVTRKVAWCPKRRATGEYRKYWWHLAAQLKFQELAPLQWGLSIRPEFHITTDGVQPLPAAKVGSKVTSKKSHMYNFDYLGEVQFWRDYLSEGQPRFILNFGDQVGVVETNLVHVEIEWPGVPDDTKVVRPDMYEDDLLTLAELHTAVSGEFEPDEWENTDEDEE